MSVHHHGYMWVGSGSEYGQDSQRRPAGQGFAAIAVVPIEPANWLLKSRSMVKATFKDIAPALEWYHEQILLYREAFDGDHAKADETIAASLDSARETLEAGADVVGGWWGHRGTTFYAVHLVACPNPWRPTYACPEGLR
ncbi:hypothetical protein [Streptomyces sp. DH12]|uniref:hypothetical protein n=1 Tax=Streptomyces sp. DH12 TaxID=2857010 RepID=UPI001E3E264C|nr:hypothetical protein [Streptomyces sp. DH12]